MADIKRTFTFEGKRYYVRGKTVHEAEVKRGILLEQLKSGHRQISRDMKVGDWCAEWLEVYKGTVVNARYYSDIEAVLNNFIIPEIGFMRISKVRPIHLQKILNNTTSYSSSYVKKIYQIIKGLFHMAYVNDLTLDDTSKALMMPRGKPNRTRRALTDYERELTLKAAEKYDRGIFILIMLYCGLRPGEVGALRWNDIDLDNRIIHVEHAIKADNSLGAPKSKSGVRDVPIPEPLYEKLAAIEHDPFDFLVTKHDGTMLTKTAMSSIWQTFKKEMVKVSEQNGLTAALADDLVLYCYRHTYCTDLQAAGVPINVAKELMGHSTLAMTSQIYTHRSMQSFRNAEQLINEYYDGSVARGVALPDMQKGV